MRLVDLNPRWLVLEAGGPIVGLNFDCPHCQNTRLAVCFHHTGAAAAEDGYILAHHGANDVQHIWDLAGQGDFEALTLTPSIDASKAGHWHGWLRAGDAIDA